MKVFLKIIGVILLIAVVLAAAVGITGVVMLNKAADGVIDESYELDEKTNIAGLLLGTLAGQDIVLTEGNVNSLISTYAGDISGEGYKVNQLFVKLNDNKGTIYAELVLSTGTKLIDKTYPITADFTLDFADTFVSVRIDNINCGELKIGKFLLGCVEKFVELPELITIVDDTVVITYDCSQLDGILEGVILSMQQDEEKLAELGTAGTLLGAIPAENVTEVVSVIVEDIVLADDVITIKAQFIDLTALVAAVGPTILALLTA